MAESHSHSSSAPEADRAMARYAEGDDSAFAAVYDELAGRLYAYLLRKTGEQACAEDLLQQTFLSIHRNRGRFIPGAPVAPWAFRIAGNLTTDMWRKDRRRRGLQRQPSRPGNPDQSDELLVASETASRLDARLGQLPESQRTAFELVRLHGLSLRETAQVCGVTVAAVKQLLFRAQTALRGVVEVEEQA